MKYIDIHSHIHDPQFDMDRDAIIERLHGIDGGTIAIGTDFEASKRAVKLAEEHENIWACIGVHPVDNPTLIFEKEKFEELVRSPKVVAIGECGLDFFRIDKSADIERQKALFLDQINFALKHDKPLMIHQREAYAELLEMLEPLKVEHGDRLRGDVHFFAGSLEEAKRFWKIGFTTSFTGVITFTHQYDEVIKNAPLEMLMSETDAPYVAPVPYRGKRNEPSYVVEVVKKIAEIRGEDLEVVSTAMVENAKKMFAIA